jgi:adhesin transport system outer membrane protein
MRKTFTAIFATATVATASLIAMPGMVQAETLGDVVKVAVTTHPAVAASQAAQRAREAQISEERSTYFPTLDLTADYGLRVVQNSTTRSRDPGSSTDTYTHGTALFQVQATQMVFDGFDTINRERAAKIRAQAAIDETRDVEEDVALRAAQAFLQVLRDRLIEELAIENVKSHTAVRDDMKVKAEGGGNSIADLRQAESRLFQARARLEELRGVLRDSIANYLEAVGTLPGSLEPPAIAESAFPQSIDEAIALALDSNPGINSAVKTVSARMVDLETLSSPYWPNLTLEATHTRSDDAAGISNTDFETTALAVLRYNIFRGGLDKARRGRAQELISQATNLEADAKRTVEEQMRIDYNAYDVARKSIPLLEQRVDFSAEVLQAYSEQFALGQRTLLDVLDIENELFTAEVALAEAETNLLFGQVRVLATMGKLVETVAK